MDIETAKSLKPGDTVQLVTDKYPGWDIDVDYTVADEAETIIHGGEDIAIVRIASDDHRRLTVSYTDLKLQDRTSCPEVTYKHSKEISFSVLEDSGMDFDSELWERMKTFGNDGFEGVLGRTRYIGGGAHYKGQAVLRRMFFRMEYDSDDDLKAIIRKIDEALETEHSMPL